MMMWNELLTAVLLVYAAAPCSAFAPHTGATSFLQGRAGGIFGGRGSKGGRPLAPACHRGIGILWATMLREKYDLIVIGAGPTGLTAALSAAAAGK